MLTVFGVCGLDELHAADEHSRRQLLHVIIHLMSDELLAHGIRVEHHDVLWAHDILSTLGDEAYLPNGDAMPYLALAWVGRHFLSCLRRTIAIGRPLQISNLHFECLMRASVLLYAGLDASKLDTPAASAETAEAALIGSFFVEAFGELLNIATVVGLSHLFPEPSKVYSARLFYHLSTKSPQLDELLKSFTDDEVPEWLVSELIEAAIGEYKPEDMFQMSSSSAFANALSSAADTAAEVAQASATLPEPDVLFVVEAEFDFDPADGNQMALATGRRYLVVSDQNGWYLGRPEDAPPGNDRFFPGTYVKIVSQMQQSSKSSEVEKWPRLPVHDHQQKIVDAVFSQRVTCIQGETGCGKSSMVPVFVLEEARRRGQKPKVIVTQPRRIGAVTVARRVAEQMGEELGQTVGYRIGQGDHVDSAQTQILYVTVGYLLHYLAHNLQMATKYTHVILDEVHERSMDSDLLNLLVKKLLDPHPNIHLVVMSATLQTSLFERYFAFGAAEPIEPIFVGVKRFPVETVFLEDLMHELPQLKAAAKVISRAVAHFEGAVSEVHACRHKSVRMIICRCSRGRCPRQSCHLIHKVFCST
jgi:hypothetical protein